MCVNLILLMLSCVSSPSNGLLNSEANAGPDEVGMTGVWRIEWDDSIDGKMSANPKSCDVKLNFEARQITGNFEGKVQGKVRDAKFEGAILGTDKPLLRFVQREGDYSCSYQISWVPKKGSVPTGVWHDTNGASGEFTLLKYQ